MKATELRYGMKVWCWWKSRYLFYNGRAYNAKDYEFVDIADAVFVFNENDIKELKCGVLDGRER